MISRLLTRFQKEALIQVNGKLISIVDFNGTKQRFPDMEINVTRAY
jgi:CRP/FNR family transcriptional regulator